MHTHLARLFKKDYFYAYTLFANFLFTGHCVALAAIIVIHSCIIANKALVQAIN